MERLIDANALHAKILEENRRNYAATENVAQILLRIETAPTIEAEPVRHGRWIKEYQYLYGGEQWVNQYCSLCEMHTRQRIRDGFYKFCPACGARMDGGWK